MFKKHVDYSEKLKRKLIQEQQKRIKPGECQKYIRAVIDEDILQPQVGKFLLSEITDAMVIHVIRKQKCNRIVTWERNVGQQIFSQTEDEPQCYLSEKFELETQLLRLFSGKEFDDSIKDKTIHKAIECIKINFPEMKITLLVVGALPKCSSQIERETSFVELQILYDCSIHFVSDTSKLAKLVIRFTKAVAEIPYKKQKSAVLGGSNQFFLNDNKDCVRVEGGNGLGRLWQQHLNRLPLVTLDVAQAILNEYSCPKKLLEEFENNPDGLINVANLKIIRGALPLLSDRRIGEVLSKRLYTLYNSTDPNEVL